jgi:hypothetical protein
VTGEQKSREVFLRIVWAYSTGVLLQLDKVFHNSSTLISRSYGKSMNPINPGDTAHIHLKNDFWHV